jgi:hypothetical protein
MIWTPLFPIQIYHYSIHQGSRQLVCEIQKEILFRSAMGLSKPYPISWAAENQRQAPPPLTLMEEFSSPGLSSRNGSGASPEHNGSFTGAERLTKEKRDLLLHGFSSIPVHSVAVEKEIWPSTDSMGKTLMTSRGRLSSELAGCRMKGKEGGWRKGPFPLDLFSFPRELYQPPDCLMS